MPRKTLPPRKAQAALAALRLQSARRKAVAERREHHASEAALALRRATPDWVEMDKQLKHLHLEAEMDAMEACIEERRPKPPILNFDLMPGFKPPATCKPAVHPDVKIQADLLAVREPTSTNKNRRAPPNGKVWKHPETVEGRNPADDWRNYE